MTSDESVPLNRRVWHLCVSAVLLSLGFAHSAAGQPTSNQVEFFERRIRPFLASECYECHGAKKQEGGLRVDSRDGLLEGGDSGPALVAGDSAKSLLIELITDKDPDSRMPMERPKLPDTVIANFVKWVNDGAPDPRDQPPAADAASSADWQNVFDARKDWWSLKPPRKPALPAVANNNWSRHPVDRFILARLEQHGLQPAAAASPRAWLRRVNFAITGLPPTPEEVQTFLNDKSSDARARVVDRLLDSPHFGERWARHWMDLVRFAESYGHEQDFDIPHAWQYRDYLICAFNADVPYGQFVREHIAGDLLENPRRHPTRGFNESVIGTGFWYLHQATHGPVDPLQDEADRIDNQIDVMSKTFLGLTVACAMSRSQIRRHLDQGLLQPDGVSERFSSGHHLSRSGRQPRAADGQFAQAPRDSNPTTSVSTEERSRRRWPEGRPLSARGPRGHPWPGETGRREKEPDARHCLRGL